MQVVVQESKEITKYIYNHFWVLSLKRELTEGELSRPAIIWFVTTFLSLQILLNEYQALRRMFCSQEWIQQKDSTKPDAIAVSLRRWFVGESY